MPPTDSRGQALVEQARQARADAIHAVEESWSGIEECHESTTQAREWLDEGLFNEWLLQVIEDIAATRQQAQKALEDLAAIAIHDRNISARTIGALANVSHTTVIRWIADPED